MENSIDNQPDFFNNQGREEILLLGKMQKLTDYNSHPEIEKPYTCRIKKASEEARNLEIFGGGGEGSLKEVI